MFSFAAKILLILTAFRGLALHGETRVVVMGDSTSVGSLTNTQYQEWPSGLITSLAQAMKDLVSERVAIEIDIRNSRETLKRDLVDRLKAALTTDQDLPQNTATRTTEKWGVLAKIAEIENTDIGGIRLTSLVHNGMRWGDKTMDTWVDDLIKKGEEPDYLLIVLGANDFCHEQNDIAAWAGRVEQKLQKLMAKFTGTKIYMTNIPDFLRWKAIDAILTVEENVKINIDEVIRLGVLGKKRIVVNKVIPVKDTLNLNPLRSSLCQHLYLGGGIVQQMVTTFNLHLHNIAEKFRDKNLRLIDLSSLDLDSEDLAVDAFHLNKTGQKKLALHLREAM